MIAPELISTLIGLGLVVPVLVRQVIAMRQLQLRTAT